MSKRLQVILDDKEMREIQRTAQRQQMTVAEWVRQALRGARRQVPVTDTKKKLGVVRAAAQHAFPTGDIDQMLHEIDQGYQVKIPS
ncbi:MAG: antitoxin [Nitrospirae bacterium]|nr:antitoxin [Nitrospirota bacterium]